MPTPSASELKKALINEGFEVYRTLGEHVLIAERVRDNLIMDSGVAAGVVEGLRVEFRVPYRKATTLRASRRPSCSSGPDGSRVPGVDKGDAEVEIEHRADPGCGRPSRTLDTWSRVVLRQGR